VLLPQLVYEVSDNLVSKFQLLSCFFVPLKRKVVIFMVVIFKIQVDFLRKERYQRIEKGSALLVKHW
jgi:hypothetical protein